MSLIETLAILIAIIAGYVLAIFILKTKGILKKYNISLWGPTLMWRTEKGISFLKKRARRKRFWTAFGNVGIVVCFIAMIIMTSMLIFQAWAVMGFTPEQKEVLPGPEIILAIPGINPIIPLEYVGYFILGLVVAMIVHEFSHGILTIVSGLKVKSLGILYAIVPMGAFCEPDEEELKKAPPKPRMRIFAAGPMSNFIVVLISIFLFSFVFMSAVQPAADGVGVFYTMDGSPAQDVGLVPGMILTTVNGTPVPNATVFFSVMDQTSANQTVSLTFVQKDETFIQEVILADKSDFSGNQSHQGQGYLGLGTSESHEGFLPILKNPFSNFPEGFLIFYILPLWGYFQGYNPIVAPFTDSYIITGPLGALPDSVFWILVNAIYWIFWLNLAVALFNVLPIGPFDGGLLFNDAMGSLVKWIKKDISDERKERLIKNISLVISLIVLILILFPFIIKYI